MSQPYTHGPPQLSPLSFSDSPFPPLKSACRYKGVYERAGFEVNRNGDAGASGASSRYSPNSPRSQNTPFSAPFSKRSPNWGSAPTSPLVQSGPFSQNPKARSTASLPKKGSRAPSGGQPNQYQSKGYAQNQSNTSFQSNQSYGRNQSNTSFQSNESYGQNQNSGNNSRQMDQSFGINQSGHKNSLQSNDSYESSSSDNKHVQAFEDSQNQKSYVPHTDDSFAEPYIKPFVPDTKNPRHERSVSNSDRNKKNLKLLIGDSSTSYVPNGEALTNSTSNSARNSPFESGRAGDYQSPSSSVHSTSYANHDQKSLQSSAASYHSKSAPYPVNDDLNSLNGSGYDPRAVEHKQVQNAAPVVGAFVPATSNLVNTFQESHHNKSIDSTNDETSFRFDSGRQSVETAGTSEDYENFLKVSSQPGSNQRSSHLSTISSIISKPHDEEVNEDEVERELQRQLESIKSGNDLSLTSKSNLNSDSSFVSAQSHLRFPQDNDIPRVTVSGANESTLSGYDQSHERSLSLDDFNDSNIDAQSHSSSHAGESLATQLNPQTPSANLHDFDLNNLGTPETIKPLSPKKHHEQEVNAFAYDEVTKPLNTNGNRSNDDDILSQNPTPSEFEAFPMSVINPEFPSFRTSGCGEKHEPGTGPCRGCNSNVDKAAKGPEKGVYSKSGELSGQWHRGCFKCSYAGCLIKFDKKVTPYVLLDNPFCHHHYHTLNNTLCGTCNIGIEGECIENELKQKWHLSCLKCTRCLQQIGSDYFLIDNKIVCEKDASAEIDRMEKEGLGNLSKVEKRRTRMLFIE